MLQKTIQRLAAPIGRVMIATLFLLSGLGNKVPNFTKTAEVMALKGIPMPSVMLAGAIVFLVVGSLSIIVGFKARIGATLLLIFLALATWFFHDFWSYEGDLYQQQMIHFMKNLSMAGTMLLIISVGSGPLSLDNWLAKRGK